MLNKFFLIFRHSFFHKFYICRTYFGNQVKRRPKLKPKYQRLLSIALFQLMNAYCVCDTLIQTSEECISSCTISRLRLVLNKNKQIWNSFISLDSASLVSPRESNWDISLLPHRAVCSKRWGGGWGFLLVLLITWEVAF